MRIKRYALIVEYSSEDKEKLAKLKDYIMLVAANDPSSHFYIAFNEMPKGRF